MKSPLRRRFAAYVTQNMLGMIGTSLYILADTLFIAQAEGADGIAALNLILPVYSLLFAIGYMFGIGSAIRFSIESAGGKPPRCNYFTNALFWGTAVGLLFTVCGLFFPERVIALLGGDASIVAVATDYTRIFMTFGPFFIWNTILNPFVRNDGSPTIAMAATFTSGILNILFDYLLMFPCGMGMAGAALATACSPLVGVAICSIHFFQKRSTISFRPSVPSLKKLLYCAQVGISGFVGEIAFGISLLVFNTLMLSLAGNTGVAAYAIVANPALVCLSVFNGVGQGAQPLLSESRGRNDLSEVRTLRNWSLATAFVLEFCIVALFWIFAPQVTALYNPEGDPALASLAIQGLRLYFPGFFFAGINLVAACLFSAVAMPSWAFLVSILRGFALSVPCAILLAKLFGVTGVWLAFGTAEALTMAVSLAGFSAMTRPVKTAA